MKKLLILFLTGLICLSLVGCGGDTTATSNSSSQSEEVKLTDDDLEILNELWNKKFVEYYDEYDEYKDATVEFSVDNKELIMKIVNPKGSVMLSLGVSEGADLMKALENDYTITYFYDDVKEKIGDKFDCLNIYFYETEKDKNNDNRYQYTFRY